METAQTVNGDAARGGVDVLLDARLTRRMSVGMKAYAAELAQRLPRVAHDLRFATCERGENFGWEEQVGVPLEIARRRPRLTHFLSVYAPLFAPGRFVITVHDLIHLHYPAFFKRSVGPYYRTVVRAVCARAARVITDDERTVEDLERFLGVPPRKVRVIPLGCDDAYLGEIIPEPVQRPFFIYAGNHREHKDLSTLLAAWASLPPDFEVDLYLTGPDDFEPPVTRERGMVRFLGDVSVERLARLYRACVALVHPALREGFGLPMLEAAAAGARVIACADAVPGILRPWIGTFAPGDVAVLRGLMREVLANKRELPADKQELPADKDEGYASPLRRIARTLTWDACARATAEVYREVLEECRRR